jgi:uncharacterized protein (TIGR02145 family)
MNRLGKHWIAALFSVAFFGAGGVFAQGATGTLTDKRDGKTYKTVKIGSQTWMAENLNYETDSSWCNSDRDFYCEKYGRLYNWGPTKKICPAGWHLPMRYEWDDLARLAAGGVWAVNEEGRTIGWEGAARALKAKSGWDDYNGVSGNGTDDYGFSALPGGCYIQTGQDPPPPPGSYAYWWTAESKSCQGSAYAWAVNNAYIVPDEAIVSTRGGSALSVRCVMGDAPPPPPGLEAYTPAGNSAQTIVDARDGRKYRTVEIGGKKWMAENLNHKTGKSQCYGNKDANCAIYGRLYDWNTAKKACPAGWHLPSSEEWDALFEAVGVGVAGKALKAKRGWDNKGNGTDDYGFSALPGGSWYSSASRPPGGYNNDIGDDGNWWTASKSDGEGYKNAAFYLNMNRYDENIGGGDRSIDNMYSVRCAGD